MARPLSLIRNAPWKLRPPIPARVTLPSAVTTISNGFGLKSNVKSPSMSTRPATTTWPWRRRWSPGAIETWPVLIEPSPFVWRLSSGFVRNVTVCTAAAECGSVR